MVGNTEQLVVNHGGLYCASGFESWCDMICQWLGIVVCYTEQVVVNHGVVS